MKRLPLYLLILFISSCIPVKIAPNIKTNKIKMAKRFKRNLPKEYGFIMEDPKEADEFYHFINLKFDRNHIDVENNVPFEVDGDLYYLSFYERERETKTWNIIPFLIDSNRESNGKDPFLEDLYVSRSGSWYLILTVNDENNQDALSPKHPNRHKIKTFLNDLQQEYLNTQNYVEAYLNRN